MIDDELARLRSDPSAATALELAAIVHVARPLLADLAATFCFYAVYAASGSVGAATMLAMGLGLAQAAWTLGRRRRVPPLHLASLVLVLVVGALSLATGDPRYVLYKASAIYLVIGATMLRRGWLLRYLPPIAARYLSPAAIVRFGYHWAALLIGTGLVNLVLVRTESPRNAALAIGIGAPGSKLILLAAHYLTGRAIVRRNVIAVLRAEDGR